jgi:hypothetical protein
LLTTIPTISVTKAITSNTTQITTIHLSLVQNGPFARDVGRKGNVSVVSDLGSTNGLSGGWIFSRAL